MYTKWKQRQKAKNTYQKIVTHRSHKYSGDFIQQKQNTLFSSNVRNFKVLVFCGIHCNKLALLIDVFMRKGITLQVSQKDNVV